MSKLRQRLDKVHGQRPWRSKHTLELLYLKLGQKSTTKFSIPIKEEHISLLMLFVKGYVQPESSPRSAAMLWA